MGYLFLTIALLAGTTKGYCGKKTSGLTAKIKDAVSVNTLRMLFCIVIGFLLLVLQGQKNFFSFEVNEFLIMAASGVFTAVFVITWLLAVKDSAYLLLEVALMLGVLVPILASVKLYSEKIGVSDWLGIACLITATGVMASYNNSQKQKLKLSSVLLLVVCGLSCGLTDLMQKLFVKSAPHIPISVFNFYTYVFAFATLLPTMFLLGEKSVKAVKDSVCTVLSKATLYILVMAVCLFANSYFKTLAAKYLDSAELYPLNQGVSLILSSLMAAVFFRERLTKKCVTGMTVAFVGLLLINVFSF